MIVTCESCKSRYKLDDAKITGRGAKITCPKCKHVFVVYARPDASEAVDAAPPRPAAPVPAPPPAQEWEDDQPTRIQGDAPPPPRTPAHEAALPLRRETTEERPKGEMAAKAAALDFRKVGVTTWKVKVKIGLIYDFSDIKTLRKYIQDGRVTASDVISCDGKSWKPIGEIPDLDIFFVETYERLEAKKAEEPPPPPPAATASAPPPDAPRATPPKAAEPVPNTFRDPFEEMKKQQAAQRAKKSAAPPPVPTRKDTKPEASRGPMLALVAVLLLAGAGAAWYATQTPETPAPTPSPTGKAPTGPDAEAVRKKINEEIEQTMARGAANVPEPTTPTSSGPPDLVPVRRDGPVAGAPPVGATPVRPKTPSTLGGTASTSTAADHEAVGDDAANGKDWGMAVAAYQKAVQLDSRSARLQEKLGEAQYAGGDAGGAQATLQKASSLGSKEAAKYLGHIAREQGDIPGANSWYQKYLAGNPKDAGDIRAIIDKMTQGG